MQDLHTPSAGESASLSRRNFITIAAASTAATLPAVALAEASGKTSLPQLTELPIDVFDRHAAGLSEVLNEYLEGRFYACIYPSQDYDYPVVLKSIAAEKHLERQVDHCIYNLKRALAALHPDATAVTHHYFTLDGGKTYSLLINGDLPKGGEA